MSVPLPLSFRQRCERIAVDLRYQLGQRPAYAQLLSSDVLTSLNAKTISFDDVSKLSTEHRQQLNTISAFIASLNPLIILYNPEHSSTRHESNLMHECAHVLLNHPMIAIDITLPLAPRDPRCEAEAAYLGACLQIPGRAIAWAAQRKMSVADSAAYFGASEDMVRYRANINRIMLTN